jgi:hypothetical protein
VRALALLGAIPQAVAGGCRYVVHGRHGRWVRSAGAARALRDSGRFRGIAVTTGRVSEALVSAKSWRSGAHRESDGLLPWRQGSRWCARAARAGKISMRCQDSPSSAAETVAGAGGDGALGEGASA